MVTWDPMKGAKEQKLMHDTYCAGLSLSLLPEELIRFFDKIRARGQRVVIGMPYYKYSQKAPPWGSANILPNSINW
jgi:hypothetical protein